MGHPKIGAPAPQFTLATDTEDSVSLAAERGRFVVLFFYPQDDTTGCTVENQEFTERGPDFDALDVTVIGISPDSAADHAKFRKKYGLKSRLAADPDRVAIEAYGVWGEKKTFGKTYMGLTRTTFIIAPDGTLADIIPVPRVKGHAARVLERIREIKAAE